MTSKNWYSIRQKQRKYCYLKSISNKKKRVISNTKIFTHVKRLKIDKNFKPCPAEDGEEVYANGIFKFNISKMIPYIQNNSDVFTPETVVVNEIYTTSPHINEDHLDFVDASKPVILAEIAPGRYNLIDGNHRAEKAVRIGINELKAYRLTVSQHNKYPRSRATRY